MSVRVRGLKSAAVGHVVDEEVDLCPPGQLEAALYLGLEVLPRLGLPATQHQDTAEILNVLHTA